MALDSKDLTEVACKTRGEALLAHYIYAHYGPHTRTDRPFIRKDAVNDILMDLCHVIGDDMAEILKGMFDTFIEERDRLRAKKA